MTKQEHLGVSMISTSLFDSTVRQHMREQIQYALARLRGEDRQHVTQTALARHFGVDRWRMARILLALGISNLN